MHKLSIIIPTFNRRDILKQLLDSLRVQTLKAFEIIVVVDGSTDGTDEMLKCEFPDIVVVCGDGNWWWTRSVNEGLKKAVERGNELFLLMNDDTYVGKDFLNIMIRTYEKKGGILGAISVTSSKPERIFYSGISSVNWFSAKQVRYHKFLDEYTKDIRGVQPTKFIPGRGMLFGKDVIELIGYLKEDLFPQYLADYDFSHTALKAGFPLNVSWSNPVYSFIERTAKGNKTNATLIQFIIAFFKPNTSNNLIHTWRFYKKHGRLLFPFGFVLHVIRNIAGYILASYKGVLKS